MVPNCVFSAQRVIGKQLKLACGADGAVGEQGTSKQAERAAMSGLESRKLYPLHYVPVNCGARSSAAARLRAAERFVLTRSLTLQRLALHAAKHQRNKAAGQRLLPQDAADTLHSQWNETRKST